MGIFHHHHPQCHRCHPHHQFRLRPLPLLAVATWDRMASTTPEVAGPLAFLSVFPPLAFQLFAATSKPT